MVLKGSARSVTKRRWCNVIFFYTKPCPRHHPNWEHHPPYKASAFERIWQNDQTCSQFHRANQTDYISEAPDLLFSVRYLWSLNSELVSKERQIKVMPRPAFRFPRAFRWSDVASCKACRSRKQSKIQCVSHTFFLFCLSNLPEHSFHSIILVTCRNRLYCLNYICRHISSVASRDFQFEKRKNKQWGPNLRIQ